VRSWSHLSEFWSHDLHQKFKKKHIFSSLNLFGDSLFYFPYRRAKIGFLTPCLPHQTKMLINVNKSTCLRIGQAYNHKCKNISTLDGHEITWSDSIRYLGVCIKSSKTFVCWLSHAKSSFYRAFKSVLGKVANAASEIVVIELLKTKCLPMLYYGLEVYPISRTQQNSLNYVLHTSFRKIFRTRSTDVVLHCMHMFNSPEAEDVVLKRKRKFLIKYASLENLICYLCQNFANPETAAVSVVWPA